MTTNKNPSAISRPINSSDGSQLNTAAMGPTLTTGNNDYLGTSASIVFTADPVEGGRLGAIRFKALGTNAATVARVFINNGGSLATAANNLFYEEVNLPATTGNATAGTPTIELSMGGNTRGLNLAKGYRVAVLLASGVAAGWRAVPIDGGSFNDV